MFILIDRFEMMISRSLSVFHLLPHYELVDFFRGPVWILVNESWCIIHSLTHRHTHTHPGCMRMKLFISEHTSRTTTSNAECTKRDEEEARTQGKDRELAAKGDENKQIKKRLYTLNSVKIFAGLLYSCFVCILFYSLLVFSFFRSLSHSLSN